MIIALSDIHQNKHGTITIRTPRFKEYSCVCHEGNTPTELQLLKAYYECLYRKCENSKKY